MSLPLLAHTSESYSVSIHGLLGRGKESAKQLYKKWYREGKWQEQDPAFRNCGALIEEITALTDFSMPKISTLIEADSTRKAALRLRDESEVEMVLLPMGKEKTLCLSTQVGCRQGCTFCQTAKMGWIRNLSASEMVAQLFLARHTLKASFRNVVFMGMGEPFDNYDEVMKALAILTDPFAFGIGPRRITISTSGRVDGIERFISEKREVNLALSLNAASDDKRRELMPMASRYDLESIRRVLKTLTEKRKRVLIGYILIDGKNSSLDDARQLSDYLRGLDVTINLIPFNSIEKSDWRSPCLSDQLAFEKLLRDQGYRVFLRTTKGQTIRAACGQLGKAAKNKTTEIIEHTEIK